MAFDQRGGVAAANPYAPLMGRTFVDLDETGPITVLDAARIETLSAWVARLIPKREGWPSAAELDTVAYIDAIVTKAPTLRPVLLKGIDAVDAAAVSTHGVPFASATTEQQTALLHEAESALAPEAFTMVLELTYEAYYRSPKVQAIVKERTGFDVRNTVVGKPMRPFPVERLQEMSTRPDHFRSVDA
mgnify:CR=1 FL=1